MTGKERFIMKKYNGNWRIIQGELRKERLENLPDCIEKEHLFEIIEMLKKEGFNADTFFVHEYPIEGVYICCQDNQENYFTIHEEKGILIPQYTTKESNEKGYNVFPCETIRESIEKTEC